MTKRLPILKLPKLFPARRLFDSHCHLEMLESECGPQALHEQIAAAQAAGVAAIFTMGTSIETNEQAIAYQKEFPGYVFAGAGLHPELCVPGSDMYKKELDENDIAQYIAKFKAQLAQNDFVFAGECGLDYYWLEKNSELTKHQIDTSKSLQKIMLLEQLKLAKVLNLPISLHTRAVEAEGLELVNNFGTNLEVIFHSYTGSYEVAAAILESGYKIGINGIVTYKSAEDLRQTFNKLLKGKKIKEPEDLYQEGFVLETDAPFLMPSNSKQREKLNSPKQIPYIWEFLYNFLNAA